jgi:hypothetical protein
MKSTGKQRVHHLPSSTTA